MAHTRHIQQVRFMSASHRDYVLIIQKGFASDQINTEESKISQP